MIDPLESHTDPTNPFAFTPPQLSALMDPKDMTLLSHFGGLQGVVLGLHANLTFGLSTSKQTSDPLPQETDDERLITMDSRASVFGYNVLPPVKSKTIFELMWCAFKDRTLVMKAPPRSLNHELTAPFSPIDLADSSSGDILGYWPL
jgi:Ca2+-transporting ATPase